MASLRLLLAPRSRDLRLLLAERRAPCAGSVRPSALSIYVTRIFASLDTGEDVGHDIDLTQVTICALLPVANVAQRGSEGLLRGKDQKCPVRDFSCELQSTRPDTRDIDGHIVSHRPSG